jgi:hypothetical protein
MGQLPDGRILHRCGHIVRRLEFLPDGRRLLASRKDGVLDMLDWHTGGVIWEAAKAAIQDAPEFMELRDDIGAVASPDGSMIASASADNSLRLWDPRDGKQLANLGGHGSGVFEAAFFPDSGRILSVGDDGLAKLWDVPGRRRLRTFGDLRYFPGCLAVSPDGSHAAIGSGTVLLWDFSAIARCRALEPATDAAYRTLQASPDDPAALAALGAWYAARGADTWAVDCLVRARDLGATVDATTLARCYWRLGRFKESEREFRAALNGRSNPAERAYLTLCLEAVTREVESSPE